MRYGAVIAAFVLSGCAVSQRPLVIPHTEPIQHVGINAGPERFTPLYLGQLASFHRPLTIRTAVQSVEQAGVVLASVVPYPDLSVLLLVEKPDLRLVASLLGVNDAPQLAGIELTNEPNIAPLDMTSAAFGAFVTAAYRQLTDGGFRGAIISGGVSDCCGDFVGYVRDANLPAGVCKGWHLYADDSDQFGAIQALGCAAITEYGQPSRTPQEDAAQTVYLTQQTAAFQRLGATWALPYQLVSGACGDLSNLANFGLLDCHDQPKPSLQELFK